MLPIRMLYQSNLVNEPIPVFVYSIEHSHDSDGQIIASFATAWNPKQEQWIVAPLWEFKPIKNKKLVEDK